MNIFGEIDLRVATKDRSREIISSHSRCCTFPHAEIMQTMSERCLSLLLISVFYLLGEQWRHSDLSLCFSAPYIHAVYTYIEHIAYDSLQGMRVFHVRGQMH